MKFKTKEMTGACQTEPLFYPVFIHYFILTGIRMKWECCSLSEHASAEDGFLEFVIPPTSYM